MVQELDSPTPGLEYHMKLVESQQTTDARLTDAEELFDQTVAEQRLKGRRTYGRGLRWQDGAGSEPTYNWLHMALEEAVDLSQYLCAELLKERAARELLEQRLAPESSVTLAQYQADALRTANTDSSHLEVAVRALGLAGEAGEVVELVKKYVGHGHPMPVDQLEKELGDVLWYVATLAHLFGLNLDDVARKNIEKLRARYPDGFSADASRNRTA